MDGWIVIGAELDTKTLEKNLKEAEKELKQFEKEAEKLTEKKAKIEAEIEFKGAEFDRKIKEIEEKAQIDIKAVTGKTPYDRTLKENKIKEQAQLKINSLQQQYYQYLEKANSEINDIDNKLQKNASSQQLVKKEIEETTQKLQQVKGYDNLKNKIDDIGKSTSNVIKKIAKWSLAVLGIRSAYNFVRQSISTLSQYNEKMATDIQYIKFALASTLQPVIEKIIQLVYKLLTYIGYVAKAWFGVNIFANASVEAFQKQNKALGSSVKNAKELKKTLTGFDEMNILQDNGDVTTGGGGGGVSLPSFSAMEDVPIPSWIEWIAKNGKTVALIIGTIAAAIAGIKIAGFIKGLKNATGALKSFKASIALVAAGIVLLVGEIINMILNWDKMTAKEKVLAVALAALGAAFITLGVSIGMGISAATLGIGALVAAIVAAIAAIAGLITKLVTEEKSIKSVEQAEKDLKKAQDELRTANDEYVEAVDRVTEANKILEEAERNTGLSGEELNKKVEQGILDYKDMTDTQKEVYKAYLESKNAQDNLKTSTEKLTDAKKAEKNASWDNQLAISAEKGQYDEYKKAVIDAFNSGELSAEEARDKIGKAMSEMSRSSQKAFMEDLPSQVKDGLDPKNYETLGQRLSKWFGSLWDTIKKAWGDLTTNINVKSSAGSVVSLANKIVYPTMPKLASGGIINMPGKGVMSPYGQAIRGEAGAEGVIPLTDSQQMALLGEAIGKYITVNANITNTMNGRVISRELKKITNENDFAFNR